ncbi:hypothetical protein JVT61DRAFT_3624 [Boletus reticuloceps]|uniref:Uncharacterized protein n=1 Tax=Boletus reticuloceps TaxID=495285 RepID=A0A8I2YN40_9AGAM|nr:hypothetical protein JVT61DRAFT_3624 [Boletus reticuloceps]
MTTTMQKVPPGLVGLVWLLPRLLFPPATVFIGLKVVKALAGEPAPRWLRVLAYLLALPAIVAAKLVYSRIRDRREAARRGAMLPPSIKYRWPGALDKLSALLWNFSNGYLGSFDDISDTDVLTWTSLAEYNESECEEIGNTFNFYALYENRASASFVTIGQTKRRRAIRIELSSV